MDERRLYDAEALRNLWDGVDRLDREARLLQEATGRVTHMVRLFVTGVVEDQAQDPRHLLLELGAALERCDGVELSRAGITDALDALGFTFAPNPDPQAEIHRSTMSSLRARIAVRVRGLGALGERG